MNTLTHTSRPARRTLRVEDYLRAVLSSAGLVLVLMFLTVAFRASWGMYGKLSEATQEDRAAKQEVAALQTEKARMEEEISFLSSRRGEEAVLRERYGLALPGEGVIQVVGEDASASSVSPLGESFGARLWSTLTPW